ncbi:unnamed protein product [Symbiodinium sp. CCMP2592]|nr:unnamed protein product [Symbiodinium sp. CCMP2592]
MAGRGRGRGSGQGRDWYGSWGRSWDSGWDSDWYGWSDWGGWWSGWPEQWPGDLATGTATSSGRLPGGLTPGAATSSRKTEWSSKFPPGQFVTALVPLAMNSYRDRSYSPIATYIQEELLCHIAMRATSPDRFGHKRARMTIKGLQAEAAWRHFVRETNKLAEQGVLADLEDGKVAWHRCPPAKREKKQDDDSVDWGGSEESLSEAGGHAAPDHVETDESSDGLTSDEETQEDAATTGPAPPQSRWERLRALAIRQVQAARDKNGLSQEAVNLVRSVSEEEPLPKELLSLRISFCICCFGRGWQLRKALPANIMLQRGHMQNVRFCISLYDNAGTDGEKTRVFIEEHFQEELANGFLVVRFANDVPNFSFPRVQERGSQAGIVGALGPRLCVLGWSYLLGHGLDKGAAGLGTRGASDSCLHGGDSGCTGRMGVTQETFLQLNGYDESFYPTGYQDIDFFERLKHKAPGWAYRLSFHRGWSIPNDRDEKVAQTTAKVQHSGCSLTWSLQNARNRDSSKEQLSEGRWFRNTDTQPEPRKALLLLKALGGPSLSCSLLAAGRIRDGLTSQVRDGLTSQVRDGLTSQRGAGEDHAKTEVDEAMEVDQEPPVQATKEEAAAAADAKARPADRPTAGMVLPPKRNKVYVDIVTCGVANLQFTLAPASGRNRLPAALYHKCKAMRLLATSKGDRAVDHNALVEMLREVDVFPRNTTEHVALDTRVFHDPRNKNTLRDHIGYHPEIIRMVAESETTWFHEFVRFVRRAVRAAQEKDIPAGQRRSVGVLCFCKSGNHRSVAMAFLLQHALQNSNIIEAVQCAHVTEMAGNWAERQCGPCDICRGQPNQVNTAHDNILRQAKHRARSAWKHAVQSA